MLGRDQVEHAVGADPDSLTTPTLPQTIALGRLVSERATEFALALAAEASENDDVSDGASAAAYARLRLHDFDLLLDDRTAASVQNEFERITADWG